MQHQHHRSLLHCTLEPRHLAVQLEAVMQSHQHMPFGCILQKGHGFSLYTATGTEKNVQYR